MRISSEEVTESPGAFREQVLHKLRLSIGDAARVAGVTVRQLSYWTEKGLVRAVGAPGKKRYDFRALERIAHIKAALNEGYTLEEAAAQASARLKARLLDDERAREVILERLAELEQLVTHLRVQLAGEPPRRRLKASASRLIELNLRALFDERPSTRASADDLARELGHARDQVRAALEALVADGTLLRQGRTYRRTTR